MTRNPLPTALALLLGASMTLACRAAERPNVILIMTDDQGYGDVGFHGNSMIQTPNLDQLAQQSLRLTNFHVEPTCAETRAALMSGQFPLRVGVWHTIMGRSIMRADATTMPELFQSAGYRTGMFGKWHLGDNYPYRPQDRGFETTLHHGGGGVGQTPDVWGNDYYDDVYWQGDSLQPVRGYCTDVFFGAAREFISEPSDRPYFCYLATNAPHGPFRVDDSYKQPYLAQGVAEPMASFYGMITNIDENLGVLLEQLSKSDLARETIVIFMTDNGTAAGYRPRQASRQDDSSNVEPWIGYNAGMRGTKGQQYDGGHRVPCYIRLPDGRSADQQLDALTAHVDLIPTLADLCELDLSSAGQLDGRSILPMLQDEGAQEATREWQPERTLVVQSHRVERPRKWVKSAVLTDRWRLIDGEQLYDIRRDPGQQQDIAAEHPQVLSRLRQAYEAWWADCAPAPDEYSRIPLGDPLTDIVRLTAHDWHGPRPPWNQAMIDNAPQTNGRWEVDVKRSGTYQFWLAARPLAQPRGVASRRAELRVGDMRKTVDVDPRAALIPLTVYLPAGQASLSTRLFTAAEESDESAEQGQKDELAGRGAYYVYAAFLSSEDHTLREEVEQATRQLPDWMHPGDRVAWLGGTLIERAQEFGWLEAQWLRHAPHSGLTFCNLGWSGDDVRGRSRAVFGDIAEGKQRRLRDLDLAAPSLVVIAYGMTEALDSQISPDTFGSDLEGLVVNQYEAGRRVVLARIPEIEFDGVTSISPEMVQRVEWPKVIERYSARREQLNAQIEKVAKRIPASVDARNPTIIDLPALRTTHFASPMYLGEAGYADWSHRFARQIFGQRSTWQESIARRMREAAIDANHHFFEMHRPQNETYLHLFRKHEQGNNAVEAQQHRPLLAEKQLELLRLSALGSVAPVPNEP